MSFNARLQWGHVFSDVETYGKTAEIALETFALQWGHVFSDVETPGIQHQHNAAFRIASMGPRLFRRGNRKLRRSWKSGRRSFNGATSFQTWKPSASPNTRQLPRSFNGATSFQTWKHVLGWVAASRPPELQWGHVFSDVETFATADKARPFLWLQWGHVFSDVETPPPPEQETNKHTASMGPRLFRRGNLVKYVSLVFMIFCFNGATSFQTWKRTIINQKQPKSNRFNGATSFQTWKLNCSPGITTPIKRFNGATSFQTWKRRYCFVAGRFNRRLQWGHVFSDVETKCDIRHCS